MGEINRILKKTLTVVRFRGVYGLYTELKNYFYKHNSFFTKNDKKMCDILFVSGCKLEAPERYRIFFQMEQLEKRGYICEYIFYDEINLEDVDLCDVLYVYRVPFTKKMGDVIQYAKKCNKLAIYDIDDLVFEPELLHKKHEVIAMNAEEQKKYFQGAQRMKKMMQLCDCGVASTEQIAAYMQRNIEGDVVVNRNAISDKLVNVSNNVLKNKKNKERKIVLGYFSGSNTHDDDFLLIENVLKKILDKYKNTILLIVGDVQIGKQWDKYSERIIRKKFVAFWNGYQELLASVDINLVPLVANEFNDGKSELKFTESALVCVPTVASATEQFRYAINDGVTGYVAYNNKEWIEKIGQLVENDDLRKKIGEDARNFVIDEYNTGSIGDNIAFLIKDNRKKKVLYVMPSTNISGGIMVIAQHVQILQNNYYNVALISQDVKCDMSWKKDFTVPVVHMSVWKSDIKNCDVLVATFWDTVDFVEQKNAKKKYYLVQNKEYLFYKKTNPFYQKALKTYNNHKLEFLTISKWCEKWLKEDFGQEAVYIPNCIDQNLFNINAIPVEQKNNKKTRVLIEGNPESEYKNVDEAFKIVNKLDKDKFDIWFISYGGQAKKWYKYDKFFQGVPYHEMSNIYRSCNILLKTSILESFSYPPLEMMACGGVCVVAENDGNKEYVRNNINALTYSIGDIDNAIAQIKQLSKNKKLVNKLQKGGFETVKNRSLNILKLRLQNIFN